MIGCVEQIPQVGTRTDLGSAGGSPAPVVTHVGPVFRVERFERPGRSGAMLVKDVVRHPGAVTVIAVRDDGLLPMVRNHRVAVGTRLLEFCAGKLEKGEDPAVTAVRELEEETGYTTSSIVKLGAFYTSPGFADEIMHVYLATALVAVPQRLEDGEDLEVVLLSQQDLRGMIARGEILDGKTLGAYLLWSMSGRPSEDPRA
jgi:ADP-ribose pyrophosphatase